MAGGKKVKNKITVIGSLNYDVILKVDRLPYKGETMAVDNSTFSAGGKGANQAVQTAKLKTPTYMVGCVGTDASADFWFVQQNSTELIQDSLEKLKAVAEWELYTH